MLEEGLLFAERYKLEKLLGRGGFAEVWLANDNLTSVQVAVKVYAPGSGLDDAGITLFTQEFSLVFDMNHTNLLRPTHFDCWNRMPYLILPYCKNGSAFSYLTNDNRITEDDCWNMLHDVAAGLAYLHDKVPPLIHQDIKPDNILISDEGHYMITDFGISARIRSTIRNGMAQEQSGGTLAYMGPERFSATPKPIMASDVWSLGAMMYELMTGGTPPFGNHGGILQKNGADIPIIEEDFSQELKDIVYSCLAKETWERPSAKSIEETAYNKLHGIVLSEQSSISSGALALETLPLADTSKAESAVEQGGLENAPNNNGMKDRKVVAKNKKMLYGGIGAGVLVILIILLVLIGGSSGNDEVKEELAIDNIEKINYDSLAQVKIREATDMCENADSFLVNHDEDKYDAKYDHVENSYVKAYEKLNEVLADRDLLTADVASMALQQKAKVTNALMGIYKDFVDMAETLRSAGVGDAASEFEKRAEKIIPYVETLIEKNTDE